MRDCDTVMLQVRLRDSLVSQLQFSKGRDGFLAWVDGVIR